MFKLKRSKHKPIIIMHRSFHMLCSNVAGFFLNVFKRQIRTKKDNFMTCILRWLGRGNEVTRTPPLAALLPYDTSPSIYMTAGQPILTEKLNIVIPMFIKTPTWIL